MLGILIVLLILGLIFIGPWLLFWSINTLLVAAGAAAMVFSFKVWLACLLIILLIASPSASKD